jgi:hypothetical protein
MSQLKRVPTGGPHAMLDDEQYAAWSRQNGEAFDRLPKAIQEAIKDTGIDTDNTKLLKCIEVGLPEHTIIHAIHERERASKDPSPAVIRPDRRGNVRLN